MKDISELKQKSRFLSFGSTFRDQLHTDRLVHPGNNGPPIPAHRALLVIDYLTPLNETSSLLLLPQFHKQYDHVQYFY